MISIKDKFLKKIALFVLVSATAGFAINNYVIYPLFTSLVQKNTEGEAIRVAKHISVNFFPEESTASKIPPPSFINELKNDFELMKLKSFDSKGRTIFSTDPKEIGEINTRAYFQTVVAKGSVYTKLVQKSALSMEGKSVTTDVVETYVPVMRSGTFRGAFELYYDVSDENKAMKRALFSSNILATGLLALFISIIFLILFKLDKIICLHQKTNKDLGESYQELKRTKFQIEKDQADLQSAFEQISSLIRKVTTTQNVTLRFDNKFYEKCYELKQCDKPDCPCFGQEAGPCWLTVGTHCGREIQGVYAMKYNDCHECDVFKRATMGPAEKIGELFNDMMHILEVKHQELEKAYEQLKVTQSHLVRHEKMAAIGTLAGGIAHEFNNILGAMLGYTEMAKDDSPEGSRIKTDLEKVLTSGNRAKKLVQEILTFSRQDDQELSPIDLTTVIKEAVDLLQSSKPSSIEVRQNVCSDCKPVVANATMIHQVLVNLYTNAVQAVGEKGIIEIALQDIVNSGMGTGLIRSLPPGDYVELAVSDNGPGIDATIKERIFDPFFTTKEVGYGTGMGLSVVHGIVEKFGGLITVDSKPGHGASFHIYLPAAIETPENNKEIADTSLTGSERILFIDDEVLLAHMNQQRLEKLGYQVSIRSNAVEALETFQAEPEKFDLVITDQTMPDISGTELAQSLLQIRPDVPIILCTGHSSSIDEAKAQEIGIRVFLMKPVDKTTLAGAIRQVLDGT